MTTSNQHCFVPIICNKYKKYPPKDTKSERVVPNHLNTQPHNNNKQLTLSRTDHLQQTHNYPPKDTKSERVVQKNLDDQKHDGGVGNRATHVCLVSRVQSAESIMLPNTLKGRDDRRVLLSLRSLSHPRAHHLVGIRQCRRDELRQSGRSKQRQLRRLLVALVQTPLQHVVASELDCRFRQAEIGDGQSSEEGTHALLAVDTANRVHDSLVVLEAHIALRVG